MTETQQGWVICADGYMWLQRTNVLGLLDPDGMWVDILEFDTPPEPSDHWNRYLTPDGSYRGVPAEVVNHLATTHGGVVQVVSSNPD